MRKKNKTIKKKSKRQPKKKESSCVDTFTGIEQLELEALTGRKCC